LQQLQKSKPNSKANDKKPKEKKEKDGKEKGKKPDWFLKEPPKDKMNVTKEYKKNKYYWCPKHKKYVMHKPTISETSEQKTLNTPGFPFLENSADQW
jgi:hypothetical protein